MLGLPSLVVDEILSFLSLKETIRCKQVCREWKAEIERREKSRDSLVFHIGYFPTNRRWLISHELLRVSNSFELQSLEILKSSSAKRYLKQLNKLKKVHLVNTYTVFNNVLASRIHLCLVAFDQIEQFELKGMDFDGDAVIKLPKLKSLAIKQAQGNRLVLDCPLLELAILSGRFESTSIKHPDKLKHLECSDLHCLFTLKTKLKNLEYLNFYDERSSVKDDLLSYMPKLRRLVLYTDGGWNELKKLERQKQLYRLRDLQILICGFDGALVRFPMSEATIDLGNETFLGEVFANYPKLVERTNYDVAIDYGLLFKQFSILPNDFFVKFATIDSVVITEVTNYTHLFGFLKHCPRLENLTIQLSKLHNIRFLDQLFLLAPTLRILTIKEDHPPALFDYDWSFLLTLKLLLVRLECKCLPDTFFETIYRRCKYLFGIQQFHGFQHIVLIIDEDSGKPRTFGLLTSDNINKQFKTFAQLTEFMRRSPFVSPYLISNL